MSLDVYLTRKKWTSYDEGKTYIEDNEQLYHANVTHNLSGMAHEAGIYEVLWRPYRLKENYDLPQDEDYDEEYEFESRSITLAHELIPIIEKGLIDLKKRPEWFEKFNSPNGWGLYEHFVPFVEKYLEACKEHPSAIVEVSR